MAVLVALHRVAGAVEDDLAALVGRAVDVRGDLVAVDGRDERAHLGGRVGAGADLDLLGALADLLHQLVADGADGHDRGDGHAALAGGAVRRGDGRVGRRVEVGVGEDQHVVLRAAEGLHALAVGGGGGVDVAGDRGGADEGDRGDVRVLQEPVHGHLVAVQDVEDAVREARLGEQLGDLQGRRGVLLARLEDEGVAGRDGDREHPHRHHGREVEGRDARDDAHRLADRRHVDPVRHLGGELALELGGDAAGQVDDLQAAGDLAEGVRVDLAVLGDDQLGDRVAVGVEERAELEEDRGALGERGGTPGRPGVLGGGDGGVDLLDGGERDLGGHGAGGRVGDRAPVARRALDALATDPVVDGLRHDGMLLLAVTGGGVGR